MPASSSSSAAASSTTIGTVVSKFLNEYVNNTPKRLKIVDCYLTYVLLTGVMQFVNCCLVGTFPFNAFLSGFISCVGSFILAVCLRLQVCTLFSPQLENRTVNYQLPCIAPIPRQVNPKNKSQFSGISPERAFADFIFAHILLHLVVINFIG